MQKKKLILILISKDNELEKAKEENASLLKKNIELNKIIEKLNSKISAKDEKFFFR
jgi:predicted RNase H-like nuclease (RuvC/YqgF family)